MINRIENSLETKILLLDTNFSYFQSKNRLKVTNFIKMHNGFNKYMFNKIVA